MRQGKVQPFKVTTGWYGTDSDGNGGMVAALTWLCGSGIAAKLYRLTTAADTAPATPAHLKKSLLLDI